MPRESTATLIAQQIDEISKETGLPAKTVVAVLAARERIREREAKERAAKKAEREAAMVGTKMRMANARGAM
jgi:hypothetical protein